MIKFPKNFLFGVASSGVQSEGTEGKYQENIYDYWYRIEPTAFHDKIGTKITSNFYKDYKKDIKLLKSLKINSYRTSIQWSRLLKNPETLEINEEGVEFYKNIIEEFKKNEIELILNLNHFDIPIILEQKYGGWSNKKVLELYIEYVKIALHYFSKDIKYWTSFNEPIVIIETQYLEPIHYPYRKDYTKSIEAMYNLSLATANFVKIVKQYDNCKAGIILNLSPVYAKDNEKENIDVANIVDTFYNKFFLDSAVLGEIPKLFEGKILRDINKSNFLTKEERDLIQNNTIDFLGVNYYQPKRVEKKEIINIKSITSYYNPYIWTDRRINEYRGWEIFPEAIYDIAIMIRDKYNNIPWFLAETGMGVSNENRFRNELGYIEDDYRIEFYKEHLYYLKKGIDSGSNCFGFHAWTGIDCWSWANAYKNRYGYIEYNIETKEKIIKKSGYWIKKIIENQ